MEESETEPPRRTQSSLSDAFSKMMDRPLPATRTGGTRVLCAQPLSHKPDISRRYARCMISRGTRSLALVQRAIPTSDDRVRAVASEFEAMLLRAAFAPVAKAMGFYGDMVVGQAMRAVTREAAGDLDATIVRAIVRDGDPPR